MRRVPGAAGSGHPALPEYGTRELECGDWTLQLTSWIDTGRVHILNNPIVNSTLMIMCVKYDIDMMICCKCKCIEYFLKKWSVKTKFSIK